MGIRVAGRRAMRQILMAAAVSLTGAVVFGQVGARPDDGPIPMGTTKGDTYKRLIIRNVTVISGRGEPGTNRAMPPEGSMDLVIENGLITNLILNDAVNTRTRGDKGQTAGDKVIDATGMFVIPGLVEMHAHLPGPKGGGPLGDRALEYAYRLYLGHGITTVRDAGTGGGISEMGEQRRLSNEHQIVAPRLVLCQRWPLPLTTWNEGDTPDKARAMVRKFKQLGADCIKISKSPGHYPDVLKAAVEEGRSLNMLTMVDLKVSETSALVASNAGVASIEHFYGLPEAGLEGSQSFPTDYDYWDENKRFRWAGRLWTEAERLHPERISALLDTMIKNGTNWNPTMAAYEDNRDFARGMTLPFRETLYTAGMLAKWGPDPSTHGEYHSIWGTADELAWRDFYRIWMKYIREFYLKGGLLTVGSDQGDIGGLGVIRELELMQEAGVKPLDVFKLATTNAARVLGFEKHCGVRVGCAADLAIVNGNPWENVKVMYGRGYGYYGTVARDKQVGMGGVKWTIKDGVVYDAQALLREVEWYVQRTKAAPKKTTS